MLAFLLLLGSSSPSATEPADDLIGLDKAPERRRQARLLAALEDMDAPEARETLEGLAGGAPNALLTWEAQAVVQRLAWRSAP